MSSTFFVFPLDGRTVQRDDVESRWASVLVERAYAKINLTLDVIGRRQDGFHEVNMVMQTVDLSDVLWLEEQPGTEISIDASVSHIPLDARNLAVIAAEVFQECSGIHRGLRIHIEKSIPVAAGLAGGSSDAAAVLRGLNRLWGTGYSGAELGKMAARIGSDVAFCVHGGCAIASGRGETIEQVHHPMKAWVVLVRPSVFVSTADVYKATLPEQYAETITSPQMVAALQANDFTTVRELVTNGLRDTTFGLYPEVEQLHRRMESITQMPVFMSGSGPTLFSLLPTRTAAQRVYNALRGFMKEVYLCRFI